MTAGEHGRGRPVVEVGRSVPPAGAWVTALSRLASVWPLVVLSIALLVRFWGIDWQLPAALYFDEMKYVAWASDSKGDASAAVTDLRNPTLFHHLLQAEYAVASLVRRDSTSQETAVSELRLARLTSALLGGLACLLTALAATTMVRAVGGLRSAVVSPAQRADRDAVALHARTADRDAAWAGFAAGLILALAPLHVHLSHYAVNDATASLFLAATLYFGARALMGGHWRMLLLSSTMAGLAFSTKYSFAVGVLLPLVAALIQLRGALAPQPIRGVLAPQPIRGAPSPNPSPVRGRGEEDQPSPPLPRTARVAGWAGGRGLLPRLLVLLLVPAGFLLGAALGAPEFIFSPAAVIAGVAEQARIGATRWNGQSDAPVWRLYVETLVQGLGWPALAVAGAGIVALALRRVSVLVAIAVVPLACLAVMLRQELFFARFALPLLPPLAILAGIGTVALARLGVVQSGTKPVWVGVAVAVLLVTQLLPEVATTVRHNQLATTTDTRVLARRWLRQRLDGGRVATEVYGQPLAWAGNPALRGYRLQRVPNFVEVSTVGRLVCEGNRYFIVASLTAERELARRGPRPQESGYDLLAREGRPVATFDPFQPGMVAPSHPDNTGIPFWYLDQYARPGPKIIVYELSSEMFACPPGSR